MSTLKDGIQSKAVDDTWGRLIRPAMPVIGDDDDGDDEIAYFSVRWKARWRQSSRQTGIVFTVRAMLVRY